MICLSFSSFTRLCDRLNLVFLRPGGQTEKTSRRRFSATQSPSERALGSPTLGKTEIVTLTIHGPDLSLPLLLFCAIALHMHLGLAS